MPPTEGETPETTGSETPAGDTTTPDATQTQGEPFDAARAHATIEAQRKSEKAAKAEAAKLAARVKELEDAGKTEAEKTAARLRELEAKEAEWTAKEKAYAVRDAIRDEAAKAGASPQRLALIVSHLTPTVEVADDGKTNAAALVAALKRDDPGLFVTTPVQRTGGADGGAGRNGTNGAVHGSDPLRAGIEAVIAR